MPRLTPVLGELCPFPERKHKQKELNLGKNAITMADGALTISVLHLLFSNYGCDLKIRRENILMGTCNAQEFLRNRNSTKRISYCNRIGTRIGILVIKT